MARAKKTEEEAQVTQPVHVVLRFIAERLGAAKNEYERDKVRRDVLALADKLDPPA